MARRQVSLVVVGTVRRRQNRVALKGLVLRTARDDLSPERQRDLARCLQHREVWKQPAAAIVAFATQGLCSVRSPCRVSLEHGMGSRPDAEDSDDFVMQLRRKSFGMESLVSG